MFEISAGNIIFTAIYKKMLNFNSNTNKYQLTNIYN